ncbi:MAG TPA: hypothetical protein VN181_08600 [Thermoanaerobaculia bacterium]|nr:hypothetical protein [Thermoanaerobaculia bacterium]
MNTDQSLEFAQAIIARLAGNSFTIKGWSIGLSTAIFVFVTKDEKPQLALLAVIPTFVFWGLDAYYMALERSFRSVYNRIANAAASDFDLAPAAPVGAAEVLPEMLRPAVAFVHIVPLIVVAIISLWSVCP